MADARVPFYDTKGALRRLREYVEEVQPDKRSRAMAARQLFEAIAALEGQTPVSIHAAEESGYRGPALFFSMGSSRQAVAMADEEGEIRVGRDLLDALNSDPLPQFRFDPDTKTIQATSGQATEVVVAAALALMRS
jgi:hypothetical protein